MCLLEFYLVIKIKFIKFGFEMRIYAQKCFFFFFKLSNICKPYLYRYAKPVWLVVVFLSQI